MKCLKSIAILFFLLILPYVTIGQSKIWGITNKGGSGTIGTIYNTDNNGSNQTLLQQFVANNAGSKPAGDLIEVNNKLYGLVAEGGTTNNGVLFSYDLTTQLYTVLYNFDGLVSGSNPKGKLMIAGNGLLYGLTASGGLNNGGVLFSYDIITSTYTNVHDFTFASGIAPDGGLVEQNPGVLYGVTYRGGLYDKGTIFKFTIAGNVHQSLHDFNTVNGENPRGTLLLTPTGYLLGTTTNGGVNSSGVVFGYKASTTTFAKLHDFSAAAGGNPEASLTYHPNTFKCYGTTAQAGANSQGTIFQIDTNGTNFLKIYDFQQLTGGHPKGSLTVAGASQLIGTTYDGGPANYGVTFTINTNGTGYNASGVFDFFSVGANPSSSFIYASNAKYYCLIANGGATSNGMMVWADATNFNLLSEFSFNDAGVNGGFPIGGLTKGSNGKVYGTASKGGINQNGIAIQMDANGSNFLKLADFNSTTGADPRGGLVETTGGKMIGMSFAGGSFNFGCIYEIDPSLPSPSTPVQKIALSSGLGTYPKGGIIKANNSKYYGLTSSGGTTNDGVLFEYNPFTNNYIIRHSFSSLINGSAPVGTLVQSASGFLFGFTSTGGVNGGGVIFKYNPIDSSFAKVYDFVNATGISPEGGLAYNPADGLLYGLTKLGGANSNGALFSFNPTTSVYALLYSFDGLNGEYPSGKLMRSDNGKLYGTTEAGGTDNLGVFFEFTTGANTFAKVFDFTSVNGAVAQSELLLMNCSEPVITVQPNNINSCPNNNVSFTCTAAGSGLAYQWYKNGVIIAGAAASTLSLSNITSGNNGNYHCMVRNTCGYVLTKYAKLSIVNKPASNITVFGPSVFCDGNFNTDLSTIYNSTYSYQWNLNGGSISGANLSVFTPTLSGNYTLTVSSGIGCDSISLPTAITVVANITGTPSVTIAPNTNLICTPANILFTADTLLVGINPYCEWKKNGVVALNGINMLSYNAVLQNGDDITLELTPNLCPSNTVVSNVISIIDTCAVLVLNVGSLPASSYCAGQSLVVPYLALSNFLPGNTLTVQLSDANGSFTAPTNIGFISSVLSSGNINCIIPAGINSGSGYRLRVVSSLPANNGNDNGFDLYITASNFNLSYTIAPNAPLVVQPLNAAFQNTTPALANCVFDWHFGDGSFLNNAPSNYTHTYIHNGVYQTAMVVIDTLSGCSDTLYDTNNSNHKVICNDPLLTNCTQSVIVTPNGVINSCIGGAVSLACNQAPNYSYQWSRNGVLLPGQNTYQIDVTQAGFYTVTVFVSGACAAVSSPVQINFNNPTPVTPTISFASGSSTNCGTSNGTLTASGSFPSFLWNTGQAGSSILINSAGTYSVIGQGSQGCDAVSAPFTLSGQVLPVPEICVVTATDDDTHHLIVWYKPASDIIDSFIVMKDLMNTGVFTRIAAVGYGDLSEYEDLNSNPQQSAAAYQIISKDTCGGFSQPSVPVRPIFLQVQANIGIQRWLNWNQYLSSTQNIATYVIYRGANLTLLDSVTSISAPANGFLDYPPGLNFVYRVEAVLEIDCEATRAVRRGSKSNGTGNLQTGNPDGIINLENNAIEFKIVPNPNNGLFSINLSKTIQGQIFVYDITGKLLINQNINNRTIDAQQLSKGTYLIKLVTNDGYSGQQLMVVN